MIRKLWRKHSVMIVVVVLFLLLAWADYLVVDASAARRADTVPSHVSPSVFVDTRAVAKDSCAVLVVTDYRRGLDGSTYRCAGPDVRVVAGG